MRKLIIHIGYPKTATSTFQLSLFKKISSLGDFEYLNHLNRSTDYLGEFYVGSILKKILLNQSISSFEEEITNLKKVKKNISILSNENISFFVDNFEWSLLKPISEDIPLRIKTVFEGVFDHIEIIMVLRSQKTLLPSFYAQAYFNIIKERPDINTFDIWYLKNFGKSDISIKKYSVFDYFHQIKLYQDVFGKENVSVLLFEHLKFKYNSFYKKIAIIFGVEVEEVKDCLNVKQNVTIHKKNNLMSEKMNLTHKLSLIAGNKFFKSIIHGRFKKILQSVYDKIIPNKFKYYSLGISSEIVPASDEVLLLLNQRFSESNTKLLDILDISMEEFLKFGYIEKHE